MVSLFFYTNIWGICTFAKIIVKEMMARLKRKYFFFIITTVVILVISIPFIFIHLNMTKISYGTLPFDKNKELLFLNETLIWDTGAYGSVLFESSKDKIPNKIQIGFSLSIDAFNKTQLEKLYFSKQHTFVDSFNIYNFFFLTLKSNPTMHKDKMGIMGMNVISTANWLIDFTSGKIVFFSRDKIYKTKQKLQLNLKYKRNRNPKTQLDFSVCQCENVLIDAGFTEELALLESDIKIINKLYKPVDTLKSNRYGIYSTTPVIQNCYVYDTIRINDVCFNNIQILEGNKRLIGFKFFKRFEKVYLNTKEKRFYFYSADADL